MSEHKLFFGGEVQGKIFVNHITDEAIISFPVRVRDLRKLEESEQWKNLCQFLEGFQTQELSMCLPASQVVVEKVVYKNPLSDVFLFARVRLKKLLSALSHKKKG